MSENTLTVEASDASAESVEDQHQEELRRKVFFHYGHDGAVFQHKFKAVKHPLNPPPKLGQKRWMGQCWIVSIGGWTFNYWRGSYHNDKPAPTAEDVVSCLTLNNPGTFR